MNTRVMTCDCIVEAHVKPVLRLALALLVAAMSLAPTASYARRGGLAPCGDGWQEPQPLRPPNLEPDTAVTLACRDAAKVLHIAEVTIESADDLALLRELGYTCMEGEVCQLEVSEAQLQSVRGAGLTVTTTGITAQGSCKLDDPEEPYRYASDDDWRLIPNPGYLIAPLQISGAPATARVTRVKYGCIVLQTPFSGGGPGDYVLTLRPSSMSTGYNLWNQLGGSTDEGHDDDAEDDRSIDLKDRWIYSYFDGQAVNQTWYLRVDDKVWSMPLDGGELLWWIWVFYCPGAPAAPSLIVPGSLSHICDTTPSFDWSDVSLGRQYWIQVDDSPSFSSPEVDRGTATSGYTPITPLPAGRYYWRVRCRNECDWGSWSTVGQFYIDQMPATPEQYSPAGGSHTCDSTPTLDWSDAAGATTYNIQVAGFSAIMPSLLVISATTSSSSYTAVSPLESRVYYWRVRGESACGQGAWSAVRNFHIDPWPATPSDPWPANGATGVGLAAGLRWASAADATSYDVYFGTSMPPPLVGTVSGTQYDLPALAGNTLYRWKIVAENACGRTHGPVWSFTTAGVPATEYLVYLPKVTRKLHR